MDTVVFLGTVMPRSFSIGHESTATNSIMNGTVQVAIRCKIVKSQIRVECDLEKYDERYRQNLWGMVWDYARLVINLIGFQAGAGLITIVDTIILPNQQPYLMKTQLNKLSQHCTAYDLNTVQQIMGIVSSDIAIIRALKDLVESLIIPNSAVINCTRVMDTIRKLISPIEKNETQAWLTMHTALNVSKDYLKFITDESRDSRHGTYSTPTSDPKLYELIERAWIIMNRFLEYKKGGDRPLTDPNFPALA